MKISVVGTLYRSENTIVRFVERVYAVCNSLVGEDFEIILVVDGCTESLNTARGLLPDYPNLVLVDLSRNFGHHKAIMAGLEHATGDLVFLVDTDLEEQPEWLDRFLPALQESEADVVFGYQEDRRGNFLQRASGNLFYLIFQKVTGMQTGNQTTARLMTRRYIDALLSHGESELILGGLWGETGFEQVGIPVEKFDTSPTTYPLARRIFLAIESVVSFSNAPLVLSFVASLIVFLSSIGFLIFLFASYFVNGTGVDGYLSVIASVWLLAGLILLNQGVQNFYIAVMFLEAKNRPRSVVRQVYRSNEAE